MVLVSFVLLVVATGSADEADRFVRRGECGDWTQEWAYAYVLSNLLISVACVIVAVQISLHRGLLRHIGSEVGSLVFFIVFITCGLGHFVDGFLIWFWPNYHVATIWHCITASFACVLAVLLPAFLRRMWQN